MRALGHRQRSVLTAYRAAGWTGYQSRADGRRTVHELLRDGYLDRFDDASLADAILTLTSKGRAALGLPQEEDTNAAR